MATAKTRLMKIPTKNKESRWHEVRPLFVLMRAFEPIPSACIERIIYLCVARFCWSLVGITVAFLSIRSPSLSSALALTHASNLKIASYWMKRSLAKRMLCKIIVWIIKTFIIMWMNFVCVSFGAAMACIFGHSFSHISLCRAFVVACV